MNNEPKRDKYQNRAQRNFSQPAAGYVFDETSRIYKPIADAERDETCDNRAITISSQPIRTQTAVDRDWVDFVLKWIGLIVSAVTIRLIWLTVCYTHQQATAANSALVETQNQTKLLRQQVESTLGAVITKQIRTTWPNKAYLSMILDNRGKVTGSNIHADFRLSMVSLPNIRPIADLGPWQFTIPHIAPSPDLPMERGIYLNVSPEKLHGHPFPNAIKITGTIAYFDGFHDQSELVCFYALGTAQLGKQTVVGPTVVTCDGLPAQIAYYRENQ